MVNKVNNIGGGGSSSGENINTNEHNNGQRIETTNSPLNEIDGQSNNRMEKIELNNDEEIKNHYTHVRVLHNFRGSNNDELCMKKDDVSVSLKL